jgi:pyruvate dehydrogenase E1 component alpha subunit
MTGISHESILKTGRYRDLTIEGIDPAIVMGLYKHMVRLRRCELALIEEYHPADEMRCPVHFCVGQEAVPAALSLLLEPDDYLFSHHRTHGYFLAKGAPMRSLFAEIYGRETGANGGKAGSQDISMASVNFYGGAILSGAVAITAGAGLALQLKNRPNIAVAGFGEGATDEGVFWETISYAALRKLPIVFTCENNRYATSSPQFKRQPADNISERVQAFGVKSHALFGNDVIAVYSAIAGAIRAARSGQGPTFIEAYTYRWNGHVGPEDDDYVGYRPMSELEFWKSNCPIELLEERMAASGMLTPETKLAVEREADTEIADAFQFAKSSPFPSANGWREANYSDASPLADRLLVDLDSAQVDGNQADAIPRPY